MNEDKYGFVYIWRDRKHKRYYIGCHWGFEDDGYICSSRWMKAAYQRRSQDFKRRILVSGIKTRQETLEKEYKWLSLIKSEELHIKYYNLHNHKFNHWSLDPEKRLKTIETVKKNAKGKLKHTEEFKKALSERSKNSKNMLGKHHTEEVKQSISKKLKDKVVSIETRSKLSKAAKCRDNSVYIGRIQSKETRQKITEGLIKYHASKNQ
jgi:hypothetical protein